MRRRLFNVTLNISTGQSNSAAREALVQQVVDELTSWNPREFINAFRRWHLGSISLVHLNILMVLEAEGDLPMGRLAESLDISVASVTGLIDRMGDRGLVERRRDSEDRRVILVHPTDKARALFQEIDERRRHGLGFLLSQLKDSELKALLHGHRALREARHAIGKRYALDLGSRAGAPAASAPLEAGA